MGSNAAQGGLIPLKDASCAPWGPPTGGKNSREDSEGARGSTPVTLGRLGSLQYHAPSSALKGHQRGEGTGVLARLLARAEPHPQ